MIHEKGLNSSQTRSNNTYFQAIKSQRSPRCRISGLQPIDSPDGDVLLPILRSQDIPSQLPECLALVSGPLSQKEPVCVELESAANLCGLDRLPLDPHFHAGLGECGFILCIARCVVWEESIRLV